MNTTGHFFIMIVFFYQLDSQILYFNTFITFLYMFRALLFSSSGSNCINTASGIVTLFRLLQHTRYERTLVTCALNSHIARHGQQKVTIFLSYLAQFFLEWEMFRTKVVEEIKTHVLWSMTPPHRYNRAVYEIMRKKYCGVGQAIDENTAHAYCMLDTKGYKNTLSCVILIPFPLQHEIQEQCYVIGTLSLLLQWNARWKGLWVF